MRRRRNRVSKRIIKNYIPKIVRSEPSLNKRYGHLTEWRYHNEGKLIRVLADVNGDIHYAFPMVKLHTLKQLNVLYGDGVKHEG